MTDYYAGIDIGSTMTKAVIINEGIVKSIVSPSGPEHQRLAVSVMNQLLEMSGLKKEEIKYTVATGYGRVNVPFADRQITEISCHAKAAANLMRGVKTVIDIGGQDCKAIKLDAGKVVDFVMNDKCAAGTGRFIEIIADSLGIKLEDMGKLSLTSTNPAQIANTCTVFAEREVVAQLTEGVPVADLVAGIHAAMATRIYGMAVRVRVEREVAISGGGAKNIGLVKALEQKIGFSVVIPPEPLLMGAIGAAFLAKEFYAKSNKH